jgi:hypothetical protein
VARPHHRGASRERGAVHPPTRRVRSVRAPGNSRGAQTILRAGRIAAREDVPAVPAALEAATLRAVRKAASSPTGRRPWLAPALVGAGVAAAMTLFVSFTGKMGHTESAARPSPMAPVGATADAGEGGSLSFDRLGGHREIPMAGDRDTRVRLIAPCRLLMAGETQGLAPKGHTSDEVFSFLPAEGLPSFGFSFLPEGGLPSLGCEYKWTGTDAASGRHSRSSLAPESSQLVVRTLRRGCCPW